jgi:16S rRNA processing protein RimM
MPAGGASQKLLMGRIGAAHGVRGEVRIQSFTEDPMALSGYGPLATNRPGLTVSITAARANGSVLIARIQGIEDRTAAEKLNGVELFVDRALLPHPEDEDEFYHADLIGLRAQLRDGTTLGEVVALPNYGAGDLIEIRNPQSGDSFLYPFTRIVVPEVRLEEGYVVIDVPLDAEPGEEEPD